MFWTRLASPSMVMCAQKVVSILRACTGKQQLDWAAQTGLYYGLYLILFRLLQLFSASFSRTLHIFLSKPHFIWSLSTLMTNCSVYLTGRETSAMQKPRALHEAVLQLKCEIPGACMFNLTPNIQLGGPVWCLIKCVSPGQYLRALPATWCFSVRGCGAGSSWVCPGPPRALDTGGVWPNLRGWPNAAWRWWEIPKRAKSQRRKCISEWRGL